MAAVGSARRPAQSGGPAMTRNAGRRASWHRDVVGWSWWPAVVMGIAGVALILWTALPRDKEPAVVVVLPAPQPVARPAEPPRPDRVMEEPPPRLEPAARPAPTSGAEPAVPEPAPALPPAAVVESPRSQSPATPPSSELPASPPNAKPAPPPAAEIAAAAPPEPQPLWQRNAAAAPPPDGRPRIAIVIDDLGLDRPRTARVLELPAPLTLSFLAYAPDLARQTAAARARGHELLVHVALNSVGGPEHGANGFVVGLPQDEVLRRLRWDLDGFDGYVGISNLNGSRPGGGLRGARIAMGELKARGLLFINARADGETDLARSAGVPAAECDLILDEDGAGGGVAANLRRLEETARHRGTAIAIGRPYDATAEALARWIPTLAAKGLVLVPASAVVRERAAADRTVVN
jgi:uncharacterized protein